MLVEELQARIAARAPGPVLYERVSGAHDAWLERAGDLPGVRLLKGGDGDGGELTARAALAVVDWRVYRDTAELREEHFGPFGLVVACGEDELLEAAAAMDGSLTASVHSVPGEEAWAGRIIELAAARAGRVVHNGFPTGVAVTAAMHHGGPYPAATFPEHTSVGSAAVRRFSRPVCYQNVPDELLPPALRAANPWRIHRTE
jgi:NADP-dependent aldehyde dehydrogenase